MGCDYFILKILNIYYNDTEYLQCLVEKEKGHYYYDYIDEDLEDYDEKVNEYIKICLTPEMKSIIIYNNGKFNKLNTENKYKTIIEQKINLHDKKWHDIIKIIKVEERYEWNNIILNTYFE